MRLDEFLVSEGMVPSRNRAKKLIEKGQVRVDGIVASKPARKVDHGHTVTIEGEDKPEGYFKLQSIQDVSHVLRNGDVVLDIGSSAGGFLMFASGIVSSAIGIEFSREFQGPLSAVERDYPNVKVIFGDAFNIDLTTLGGPYDVILNDMTVEPLTSVEVSKRFLPLLKEHGRVMQVVKLGPHGAPEPMVKKLEEAGLTIQNVIRPEKMEAYIVAQKN